MATVSAGGASARITPTMAARSMSVLLRLFFRRSRAGRAEEQLLPVWQRHRRSVRGCRTISRLITLDDNLETDLDGLFPPTAAQKLVGTGGFNRPVRHLSIRP